LYISLEKHFRVLLLEKDLKKWLYLVSIKIRLTVKLDFDFDYWNRFDLMVLILEIESKVKLISIFLKLIWFNSSRFSISILEIESNC